MQTFQKARQFGRDTSMGDDSVFPVGRDPETGRFSTGNKFWEARSSAGPKPKFEGPDDLWAACCEYFDWVDENPLWEAKAFSFQGKTKIEELPKMRPMTIGGLCLFLDVDETTWRDWKDSRADLSPIISRAETIIYQQKFGGAAADLLNPNIIARDLGLADKREVTPFKVTIQGDDADL